MIEIKEKIFESVAKQKRYSNAAKNIKLYTEYLIEKDLPPLVDLWYLSELTEIPIDLLCRAILNPKTFYRSFKIPKRRGGQRLVEAPIPSLLLCQRWIVKNILSNADTHPCATAYIKGTSLLKNVQPHAGQRHLLKIDLKDFFHSITINRVISVFRNFGYLPKISYELASLCCLEGRLPQGSATSPVLSNIIAKRLDIRLQALSSKHGLKYTRYSDDLTFSGDSIPSSLVYFIEHIVSDEGFTINEQKTRLYTSPGRRIVTGVSVREKELKLPRNTKRKIRQDCYELLKDMQSDKFFQHINKDVFFLESLKGRLTFWSYVEPESEYPIKTLEKLNKLNPF